MMRFFQLALAPFLLSLVAGQSTAPNNVSSRLMIHVSAEFGAVKSCETVTSGLFARTFQYQMY